MPHYVVDKVVDALNTRRKAVNGSRMLVAGVAYKRDIDDMRESPALDVMHLLEAKGALVDYADPYVPEVHGREWPGRRDLKAVEMKRGTSTSSTTASSSSPITRRSTTRRMVGGGGPDRRHAQRHQEAASARVPAGRRRGPRVGR